jgi:hypothetical protein
VTTHQYIVAMIGGMIGLVLSVPAFWGILKWIEHRDMYSLEREMRKRRKKEKKR